jgi:nucleotide-binding universal stress UspA family protein
MPVLKRILVATDLSEAGQRAVMRAGQLARQWEARLFLAHARPDWNLFSRWPPAVADSYQDVAHSSEAPLRAALADLEWKFGLQARCDSRLGKASGVIATMVAELEPHLVVIGARGEHESAGSYPCLGGTALKLIARVQAPLLLVRRAPDVRYSSALVAVDTPDALSRRAVLWGSGLVEEGDCHIVHAYDVPYIERMRLMGIDEAVLERRMRQSEEAASLMARELAGAAEGRAKLHPRAVRGEPVTAIVAEIERLSPHLAVLGKRGPQAPASQHEAVGGVGLRVAYHSSADVLMLSS